MSLSTRVADEVYAWADKYEELSMKTCMNCGKPAEFMTLGWISYLCEDCAADINGKVYIEDIDAYYNNSEEYIKTHLDYFKQK